MRQAAVTQAIDISLTGVGEARHQAHPRRVLLAVAGLSPQILTETLFALAVAADPPWIPTEIRLITTSEGAERARLSLLSADPGWFSRLLKDYRLPPVPFSVDDIVVITDAEGHPLPDIRDLDDNARVADQITETVRDITADPNSALHVSLAGGRKTMGYYAGYALSLFGRAQDRLSHVLVSEPFEQSWAFFYPTPYPRVIETRDGKLADTQSARVTLAEVPFVRLRDGVVPGRLLSGQASFGETIAAAQRALQPAELVIDLAARCIRAAGEIINLPPAPLAFLALMARRRQKGLHPARWNTEGIAEQYLSEYRRIVGRDSAELDRVEKSLAQGMTKDDFDQRKARTNRELTRALGDQLAEPYLIHSDGARPHTRYRLALEPAAIHFPSLAREGEG
ncbi:CRISPR-associated ring nuclease Csm6 [Thiorhodovibrio frisius]|uniref:CRISPR-associated protein, NE0113 family n=1 Tax=Thiorhodovibrio frisius TaxID=631362 RepID=H8Z1Z7_9GAMM|nr:CRISPR-associated ring nuclease Csm6 [Thiorhodovibrio frisius]EIC21522.1 CRISPR-associated protein, NE0113 family [Thiorhodovibrio frisius]WPL24106.1 CRISPR-associated protein, family [Thiorhodovibrio frisius]